VQNRRTLFGCPQLIRMYDIAASDFCSGRHHSASPVASADDLPEATAGGADSPGRSSMERRTKWFHEHA
jgi:hypothetical protein